MSDKYQITQWEASFILINSIMCKLFTTFPRVFVMNSGNGQWLTTIMISILAILLWLFVCARLKKFEKIDILEIAKLSFGKIGQFFVATVILVYLLFSSSMILRDFSEFMHILFLVRTPLIFIGIILSAGMIAGPLLGFHAIYRTHFIWTPIILLITLVSTLPNFFEHDKSYFFPILGTGANSVFVKGFFSISIFSDLIILLLLNPFLRLNNNIKGVGIFSIIVSSLFIIIIPLGLVNYMQWPDCINLQFPIYYISRDMHFGRFLQRLDSIFIITWSISILMYLATILFFITHIVKKVFSLANSRPLSWLFGIIIMCISFLVFSDQNRFYHLKNSLLITWTIPFVLPYLLSLKKGERRGEKNEI